METFDDAHSMANDRHITTASHPADRTIILLICWTDRFQDDQRVTRIIMNGIPVEKGRNMPKKSKVGKMIRMSAGEGQATTVQRRGSPQKNNAPCCPNGRHTRVERD